MKGIVLAGGSGTRLYPITKGISKQLMPIYDKPMVYYPISVLMLAGIREILIISTPYDLPGFKRLLGDGSDYGVHFEYAEQPSPDGLAQAFTIGKEFIGDDSACLVLGDNIFYGSGFTPLLKKAVADAENGKATVIQPSARGEYEITTVNQQFLRDNELKVALLGRGFACLEAIAYRKGWISEERMRELAQPMIKNQYGQYLLKVIDELKREVNSTNILGKTGK